MSHYGRRSAEAPGSEVVRLGSEIDLGICGDLFEAQVFVLIVEDESAILKRCGHPKFCNVGSGLRWPLCKCDNPYRRWGKVPG
jgi:hypothetical protein